ncbi:ABC-three component system middle component 1 [Sphingobacterium chuzhouense]|uniref:Uncharacterized protein n=1 Tax=Sphingobacterium chuzhouense TaxID=1742264 RepID=A0ABR7XT46_9SPHI|nr:ABC-three component system middle component 1 [Sphingobacterium chuzhouense]MBD1422316.1 hypothetical protein [Sphingobacterium chuzhouense]
MKELIKDIFIECGFVNEESNDVHFYRRNSSERVEYYLLQFISTNQLETFNQEALKKAHELFQEKKKLIKDVGNNTSLIVCVEFSTFLEDCIKYKNQMLAIEEDDYWFKKYLLPYTMSSVDSLRQNSNIIYHLNETVSNNALFEEFTAQIYSNEKYFLAVQFFLKLPFLNLTIDSEQRLDTIEQLLATRISFLEQNFLNEVLLPFPIESFNRDRLLQEILDPNSQSFDSFINSFTREQDASDT